MLIIMSILKQIGIIVRPHGKESIKSLIFLKTVAFRVPSVLSLDTGNTVTSTQILPAPLENTLLLQLKLPKASQIIHINIFQTTLRMSVIRQYFCNLLAKKKQLTSYLFLTLTRLLPQIVYLIEHHFLLKMKYQRQQTCSAFLSCLIFFIRT